MNHRKSPRWKLTVAVTLLLLSVIFLTARATQWVQRANAESENHEMSTVEKPGDAPQASDTVKVKVFNKEGRLIGPVDSTKVVKTDAQWKAQLSEEQYRILRQENTESAFCGILLDNKEKGVYACVGCGLPLFSSDAKFISGTGWPSFYAPLAEENITEKIDSAFGMVRTEILCARCGGHLGHVFDDGPKPTGRRYCLNGTVLNFTLSEKVAQLADAAADEPELKTAVLAGGCFWCTEAVFEKLNGVVDVVSGYAGGTKETADYQTVSTGKTDHAEVIRITYDPAKVSYDELLKIFFTVAHDPTTLNRQGGDVGRQYRSAVFYADEKEKQAAASMIEKLLADGEIKGKIVTTLEPFDAFYLAEKYHQDYARQNPTNSYINSVAKPKVEKLEKLYAEKLKGE